MSAARKRASAPPKSERRRTSEQSAPETEHERINRLVEERFAADRVELKLTTEREGLPTLGDDIVALAGGYRKLEHDSPINWAMILGSIAAEIEVLAECEMARRTARRGGYERLCVGDSYAPLVHLGRRLRVLSQLMPRIVRANLPKAVQS